MQLKISAILTIFLLHMRIRRPPRLRPGDVIGIAAPASPPRSLAELNRGIRYLERTGFRVEAGKHIHRRHGYLAGTDSERASDLNALIASRHVKAIFTVRGGFGSHRILPLLRYDLIRRNPKILVGYSDITALHCALLAQAGIVSFSGPMVAGEMAKGLSGKSEEDFWRMLMSPELPSPMKGITLQARAGGAAHRPRQLSASGRLLAGNLSLLDALAGTEYFPYFSHQVLLLEEIDERPYRIDRMLQHMKLSGAFSTVSSLLLGDFRGCTPKKGAPSLRLKEVFQDFAHKETFSVISGMPYGHMKGSASFPVGVKVRVEETRRKLVFLESGVS